MALDYSVYPLLAGDIPYCQFREDTTVTVFFVFVYSELHLPLKPLMLAQTGAVIATQLRLIAYCLLQYGWISENDCETIIVFSRILWKTQVFQF